MPPLPPVANFGRNLPALSGSDDEHLAKILLGTLAIDRELRESAEKDFFVLIGEQSSAFVRSLVTLTVTGYPPAAAVRAQAALVLRLYMPSFWSDIDPDTREWLKIRLLVVLSENFPREIRSPVLLALVSVAISVSTGGDGGNTSYDLDDAGHEEKETFMFEDAWPEFSAKLFGNLASGTSHELRNALEVVSMLSDSDECVVVISTFFKYAAAIMAGLERGLADCSPDHKMAAAFCAVSVLGTVGPSDMLPVVALSPRLLNMLMAFVEEGQFDIARSFVEMIVGQHTWYWALSLDSLGRVLLQLIALPEVQEDEDKRRLYLSAVEVMLSIFEEHFRQHFEPCMFLCPPLFHICAEGLMDADNTEAFDEAKCSLQRLATALGGVDISNLVRDCLGQYILSLSWQHRHAGVCAIAEIHEASVGAFEEDFDIIVSWVKQLQSNDPHPRVRSAAALTSQKLTSAASS